jgi:hypothetical protein
LHGIVAGSPFPNDKLRFVGTPKPSRKRAILLFVPSAGQKNSPSSLARFIEVGIIVTQNMVSGIELRYIFGLFKTRKRQAARAGCISQLRARNEQHGKTRETERNCM